MKVAKAPEKIILAADRETEILYDEWVVKDLTDNIKIEYVRMDIFIEKAADYIKKDMLDNLAFQGRLNRIEIIDGIIEKFIKAMKGE